MPLTHNHTTCWVLLVYSECTGELHDHHLPSDDPRSVPKIEDVRWHLFARDPMVNPPQAELQDRPCMLVQCRACGNSVGDGEHFADAEHAWEAATNDGWQRDLCPFCQPYRVNSAD